MISHDGAGDGAAGNGPASGETFEHNTARRPSSAEHGAGNPLGAVGRDLSSLQAYAAHYLAARSDALMAKVKRAAVWALLGIAGLLVATAALVVAVVLVLVGISNALAELWDRVWAGQVVTGAAALVLAGLGVWLAVQYWFNLSRRKTRAEYERRREQERTDYGRDVAQRASS